MITTIDATARPIAAADAVCQCAADGGHASEKVAGVFELAQPEEIADLRARDQDGDAVREATTTGRGMNLTADPIPVTPSRMSITPAIIVHMNRPEMP
jgi:hypothetical protein